MNNGLWVELLLDKALRFVPLERGIAQRLRNILCAISGKEYCALHIKGRF